MRVFPREDKSIELHPDTEFERIMLYKCQKIRFRLIEPMDVVFDVWNKGEREYLDEIKYNKKFKGSDSRRTA